MLTSDSHGGAIRHNEKDKLWAVKRGTPQYAGWCNWYYFELGKWYFPEWLTVPFEWPPTTDVACELTAKWLSDIRDAKGVDGKVTSDTPVRANPGAWKGDKALPPSPPCQFPEKFKQGAAQ